MLPPYLHSQCPFEIEIRTSNGCRETIASYLSHEKHAMTVGQIAHRLGLSVRETIHKIANEITHWTPLCPFPSFGFVFPNVRGQEDGAFDLRLTEETLIYLYDWQLSEP